MKPNQIRLKDMRAIARYETTYKALIDANQTDGRELQILGRYFYTLEDLGIALRNIRAADPVAADFQTYWIQPIRDGATHFSRDCLAGGPASDAPEDKLFRKTWTMLADIPADRPGAHLSDVGAMPKIDAAIAEIEAFLRRD